MADDEAAANELMEHLLAVLRDADPGGVNMAPPEFHRAHGSLLALDRLGVLNEEQVKDWGERLTEATERFAQIVEDEFAHPAPIRPVQIPELDRASIGDVLERQLLMIDRVRQAAAVTGRTLSRFENPARETAVGVLQALVDLDLVSELDERRWVERFERAADPDAEPLRIYDLEALVADRVEVQSADPVRRGDRDQPLVHPRPFCSFESLTDVLVVTAPKDALAQIGFIELYSDGFAVTWTQPAIERRPAQPTASPRAEASDDLDTFYFPGGSRGSHGGNRRSVWSSAFAPAVPPEATRLRITINDEGFILPIPVRSESEQR
jgi:hypothetical protein